VLVPACLADFLERPKLAVVTVRDSERGRFALDGATIVARGAKQWPCQAPKCAILAHVIDNVTLFVTLQNVHDGQK